MSDIRLAAIDADGFAMSARPANSDKGADGGNGITAEEQRNGDKTEKA
jgi:hypothetical protein